MGEMNTRLHVLIVGGGIAGLAAGLMLREWIDVTILESASQLKEIGAAVTLGPGAVKILRRFGVHLENDGGVVTTHISLWNGSGVQVASVPFNAVERAGEVNISVHRADLHAALLRVATNPDGPGAPCKVLTSHVVVQVDTEAGRVTTANGSELSADVIVGADGIRSVVRPFVVDGASIAQPVGESAYRFLLRPQDLQAIKSPLLVDGQIPPIIHNVVGDQRKIIAYPCRGSEVFNCAAFIPDAELHETPSDKWSAKGDIDALIKAFEGFGPWTDVLKLAKDVGIWQIRDLDPLPHWVKGRTILIGDAAHPMTTQRAAGAMSAIEDAEALSVFLRKASPNHASIQEALDRIFRVRYKRASLCQNRSRAWSIASVRKAGKEPTDDIFELWMYPGAERWEVEHPDMVLSM